MSTVTIEMECEQVDVILVQVLKEQYLSLKNDLDLRQSDDYVGHGFFENDKDADCAEIQSHMDAVAKVLSYNMIFEDYEDWMMKKTKKEGSFLRLPSNFSF